MARWLIPLSVVLLLVLAAHGIVLWGVAQQMQAMTGAITQPADPLFTRQITQQGIADTKPSLVVPSKNTENRALSAVNTAQSATKNIAVNTTKTAVVQTDTNTTPPDSTSTASVSTSTQASNTQSFTASASTTAATDTTAQGTATNADAAASLALLGAWPSDTRLTYELTGYFRGELHGDAQVQWTRFAAVNPGSAGPAAATLTTAPTTAANDANNASNRYQVRINLGIGPISSQFISQGRIRATGLVPEAYEEQLSGTRRRTLTIDTQSAILQDGRRVPRPDGPQELVQDTASQFVELGQRFTSGRARLVAGETVRVWLARPGGMDEWTYEVGPAETIDLPKIGPVLAYGLTPRPIANPRGTITAQMWFAPSLQNLPVRIKVTLNNETHVDLRVKKIEQR